MGHYDVLGVESTATVREIRLAYLDAARRNHPDFHTGDDRARRDAEVRMRAVNEAWAVLGDPAERARYDLRFGHGDDRAGGADGATSSTEWRPFDDGPVADADREWDDQPVTGAGLPGWLRMAPVLCFLGGVFGIVLGSLTGFVFLVALGILSIVASGLLFIVAPMVALSNSRRGDRDAR